MMRPDIPASNDWRYSDAANAWRKANHPYVRYTMAFNPRLEFVMFNKTLPPEQRIEAALIRHSHGNLSDIAICGTEPVCENGRLENGDRPMPMTQKVLAKLLDLAESTVSEYCKLLRSQGMLEPTEKGLKVTDGKQRLLPLADSRGPQLFASLKGPRGSRDFQRGEDSDIANSSTPAFLVDLRYADFEQEYLAAEPLLSQKFSQLAEHIRDCDRRLANLVVQKKAIETERHAIQAELKQLRYPILGRWGKRKNEIRTGGCKDTATPESQNDGGQLAIRAREVAGASRERPRSPECLTLGESSVRASRTFSGAGFAAVTTVDRDIA